MRLFGYAFAIVVSVLVGTAAIAQSGEIDQPSISAEAGHIYLVNQTTNEVVFYLESESTERTEHRLAAGAAATFTGSPGDTWFNIEVFSNNTTVAYGLDAGGRHYFEWNSAGVLDVYKMSAK